MTLWLIALIPFFGAVLPSLLERSGRNACAAATGVVTLAALVLLLSRAPAVYRGEVLRTQVEWLPQIGLSFSFFLDGLGLFFAALILGIGLLIIIYARFYLGRNDPIGRFYAYLLLFQGAMVGIVLSDNILGLLVFWELTSLTSFLLIGYWRHLPEARQGARMALIITAGGGLSLIAGMLLLGHIAGSYQLTEILARGAQIKASPLYVPALLLILGGAFTKSAQFPFHFWLPHAMAAPTPVSAYLHSATMVKAGVFLLARLWPALAGTDTWFMIVAPVGMVTMLIAAWIAIFKDDLKQVLAFSTVSHLGMMTMLLGLGTPMAAVAAVFHILNHATFKAALFMSAGVVDHEAGTRDIRRLGGLLTLMPITATLSLIAAASMAGIPLLNGFLSKEMMLEQVAQTSYLGTPWLFPALAGLATLLSVAYSARLGIRTFLGPRRHDYPARPHDPSAGMWLPIAVLVLPVLAIGLMPATFAGAIVERTALAVVGGPLPEYHLALWHGITPALLISLVALAGGAATFFIYHRLNAIRLVLLRPDAKTMFEAAIGAVALTARRWIDATHTGSLQRYVGVIVGVIVVLGAVGFWSVNHGEGTRPTLPMTVPAVIAWIALIGASIAVALQHHDRILVLILTSVVGLVVSLGFMQFSAPDLALTQISVEVVTTILLLLALNLLPRTSARETRPLARWRDAGVASVAGIGIAGLAYAVMTRGFDSISAYHLAESKPGGGGTNVVNVILVDFRGFDTFGEIIVLGIAAITIFALLDKSLKGAAARRLAALRMVEEAKDAHPMILVVATRVLLPLALTVGAYIFMRGHNQPGGGFIAGLIVAIALITQYMASGYVWAAERRPFDAHALIGGGIAIAGLTGIASWVFERPFLTSAYDYLHLPVMGEFGIASAVAFDLGVFLTVVGVTILSLAQISRIAQRAERSPDTDSPMDIHFAIEPNGTVAIADPVRQEK
ncbi:monovalent cation/H+ antiporter subunit A [Mesorhizobium tianshanense]|uniref:Multisubunit potassium/proton antiporter, PhaA subunit (TC 2.A.63.1.1)/multisubunit potassium/proton antiporter, PhaB subunit (TC 2.A.63.1.1) n=1 Tax=Mesorhizobium tianshanense TaxID=39844 RepID=A0A562PC60_9HYPH|nr:monovalent cation/H+ antiporter subunit A [Mesorhizobium tianshanense]TWI42004.1 multisubunit potassium/proton antiporter, PhaA subunit (TC 2.A.63.1.1)/multisubunit potassium/proton antiporter, PhaB subunit (TC 2.A.63.1.1) [Mesorhizobium tianshanense]GLS34670.1 monovalent cation/H+ antiporter subunit A [Mesorhizobium tianshanense]